MLERHDEILDCLADNDFLYPEGYHDTASEKEDSHEDRDFGETASDSELASLSSEITLLREKLDSFESEGTDEILDKLAGYQYQGETLRSLAEEIREKTSEFDFLGASEILDAWEKGHL